MFGDFGFCSKRRKEQRERYEDFKFKMSENKVVLIEIGAGSAVPTVRDETEMVARRLNAPIIRINPVDCDVPDHDKHIAIKMNGDEALKKIDEMIEWNKPK